MCASMADIHSATAEISLGKKERKKKNKRQDENIMVCPIPYGDHNNALILYTDLSPVRSAVISYLTSS